MTSTLDYTSYPEGLLLEVERFLATDPARPPGFLLYPEVFDLATFFPLQRKGELSYMMETARKVAPKVVMEIGADKGGSLYHWCKCHPTVEMVIACEIRGTPYKELFERAFPRLQFLWGEISSLDPGWLKRLAQQLHYGPAGPRKIDCLFIDGDKLTMEQDFDAYLPLMNPKGIVFIHDIQDREPRDAYWRIRARGYRGDAIVNTRDTQAALDREREGLPVLTAHEEWLRHWRGRSCGVGTIYLGAKE